MTPSKKNPPPPPQKVIDKKKGPPAIFRFWPYAAIGGAFLIFYWPVLSAQGWLWNDFPEQNFVYRLFAAVSLKQGEFPFWNPYVFSGMPFFADVQAAVLYPLNLLLTPFANHDWLSPLLVEYQVLLHVLLAGLFMYWLCRDLGIIKAASVLAAITFMFCGFLTAHIFHTNLIQTAVWFPLVVLLFRRTLLRRSVLYCALCALTLAVAFLSGYPQLMLFFYYWLAAYAAYSFFIKEKDAAPGLRARAVQAALVAALVALSVGMTSVQLLPTNELGLNSARPTMEYLASCEGSFHPYRLVTLLAPKFFGTPTGLFWGISAADVHAGAHTYWETAAYCGVLPLLLAVLAVFFVRTPLTLFLSIIGGAALLLAMGDATFFYHIAYTVLPGFNRFRGPGRLVFVFGFSVALLAAYGLQFLLCKDWRADGQRRKRLLLAAGVFAIACIAAGAMVSGGMLYKWVGNFMLSSGSFGTSDRQLGYYLEQTIYPALTSACWTAALFGLAAAALVALRVTNFASARFAGAGAVIIVVADMLAYGYGFAAQPGSPDEMYRPTPMVRELQRQLATEFFRVNSRDSKPGTTDLGGPHLIFQKNQGSVHRLFLMEGYNPLRLKREIAERNQHALDILNVKYAILVDEAAGSMGLAENPSYLPRARMAYRYRVNADEKSILPELWSPSFDHRGTVLLEERPAAESCDSCAAVPWRADITGYGLNKMAVSVETGRDGLLVLSEIHYPCWKALVDGRPAPLYRADYALRAIPVPAGKHTVVCFYDDALFRKGGMISLVSLVIILGMIGAGIAVRRQSRKKGEG